MIIQLNTLNPAVPSIGLLTRKFLTGFLGPNFPFKDPKYKSARGGCTQRTITRLSNYAQSAKWGISRAVTLMLVN